MKLKNYVNLTLAVLMVFTLFSGCKQESPWVKDGIYASCGNYDFTIYRGLSSVISIRFYLTCENPLPEGTTVHIDTSAEYDYVLQDITPESITTTDYPYGLYCCVRGMDFKKLKKLEIAAAQAQAAAQQNADLKPKYESAVQQLTIYHNQFMEDYEAMMAQPPKPEFYHYLVDIQCRDATGNPEIRQVQLVADGWRHTVDIGAVRVRDVPTPENVAQGVTARRLAVQGGAASPWYPYAMTVEAVNFNVDEDVVLSNAYFYGDATAQIASMELTITSPSGNQISSLWESGETLQLRKGEKVTGVVNFGDTDLNSAEYGSSTVLVLEFDRGEEKTTLLCGLSLFRRRNPQEVYLWAFKNADIQSYYQYLYGTV